MRFLAGAAIVAIAVALWRLEGATAGLSIVPQWLGTIPVTVFRPAVPGAPAPAVVIAHGFAGSQQLMQPFAVTLARNGFVAVTFDFPGHGRNPAPLGGGLADDAALSRDLLGSLAAVVALARTLPGADGRVALLGHSMASDVVVRAAIADRGIEATVAVSLVARDVTATAPRNLLVIDGALEPALLIDEAHRVVGMAAGGRPRERVTYGGFADGTARRFALAGGVEHIGVLYARESLEEALAWLNGAFARSGAGFVDARGPWLGLLFLGLVALAWPLAALLPEVSPAPRGAGLGWRRLLPIALAPAILTPLILWKAPTDFLPILLGDYLAAHFALYGVLTFAGLRFAGAIAAEPMSRGRLAIATLALAAYGILAVGLPIDRYVTAFMPEPGRLPLVLAMLCGTLPWFLADEWLTRGAGAARGAYAATKLCFLVSLAAAVALNLKQLFFLIIIVPVILVLFTVYGSFSAWTYARTRHPAAAAIANALVFAWAIAVTFPAVGR